MKNKGTLIISGLIVLVGGYFIYHKYYKPLTKEESISMIVSSGHAENPNNILASFDEGYVVAWGTAIKKGNLTFEYKGVKYNVEGGKSLK